PAAAASPFASTCEAPANDCRSRPDYRLNLGLGNRYAAALCFDQTRRELLRFHLCLARIGRPPDAWTALQATQPLSAKRAHRGLQTGAPLQCPAARGAPQG